MVTFLICIAVLVVAYFSYGAYLDRGCKIEPTADVPSVRLYDGVDYIPMPRRQTFLIQLLNIAGIGPIFGAILGACFGPVVFLWITFGGIFVGAMHDYHPAAQKREQCPDSGASCDFYDLHLLFVCIYFKSIYRYAEPHPCLRSGGCSDYSHLRRYGVKG